MIKEKITPQDLDKMWKELREAGHKTISKMPEDWRWISPLLICQIPYEYSKMIEEKKNKDENSEGNI